MGTQNLTYEKTDITPDQHKSFGIRFARKQRLDGATA